MLRAVFFLCSLFSLHLCVYCFDFFCVRCFCGSFKPNRNLISRVECERHHHTVKRQVRNEIKKWKKKSNKRRRCASSRSAREWEKAYAVCARVCARRIRYSVLNVHAICVDHCCDAVCFLYTSHSRLCFYLLCGANTFINLDLFMNFMNKHRNF